MNIHFIGMCLIRTRTTFDSILNMWTFKLNGKWIVFWNNPILTFVFHVNKFLKWSFMFNQFIKICATFTKWQHTCNQKRRPTIIIVSVHTYSLNLGSINQFLVVNIWKKSDLDDKRQLEEWDCNPWDSHRYKSEL